MKSDDILDMIGDASGKHVWDAQQVRTEKKQFAKAKTLSRKPNRKAILIAAIITIMLLLMGAAIYTRWSSSMQKKYDPSEEMKQQAEKTELSVMYDSAEADDGSVLSVTDQGVTVSVVQTIVDQSRAEIVLKVEGLSYEEGFATHPCIYKAAPTLDGDELFWVSTGSEFDDGIIRKMDMNDVYTDGTPVERDSNGYEKGHYIKNDGSMELTVWFQFQDPSENKLGKEIALHFTGFGIEENTGKAEAARTKIVEGKWDLHWILKGSDTTFQITPNLRLSDNVTLVNVEIGQLFVKAEYHTDSYFSGWEHLEPLSPSISGIKMKNGVIILCVPSYEGYYDESNGIYQAEYRSYQRIMDLGQIESLVIIDHWEEDSAGNLTVPVYSFIPV